MGLWENVVPSSLEPRGERHPSVCSSKMSWKAEAARSNSGLEATLKGEGELPKGFNGFKGLPKGGEMT